MDRATVGSITYEYAVRGSGPAIVFIHGALIADAFAPILGLPDLASYRLITYRRRGYGGSTPSSDKLTVVEQAEDCAALLRYLHAEPAHIVGHSLGGSIALELAVRRPGVVRSLALLEPAFAVGAARDAYRASLLTGRRRYQDAGAATVVDEFLEARWPGYRTWLDQIAPMAFEDAVASAPAFFDSDLLGLLEWDFEETQLSDLKMPILSMLGERSQTLSPRFADAHNLLLSALPNVNGHVMPEAAHMMPLEKPGDTARALATFLARVTQS